LLSGDLACWTAQEPGGFREGNYGRSGRGGATTATVVKPVVAHSAHRGSPGVVIKQATASPSMMQERERRRASASTIRGKR